MVNTKGSVYDMGKTKLVSEYHRFFSFICVKPRVMGKKYLRGHKVLHR